MDDEIEESPTKRRKLATDQVGNGYDSQDDSGDELLADYETVETLPVRVPADRLRSSSPSTFVTQPTQPIMRKSPEVQVQVSSPLKIPPTPDRPPAGGRLANSMAPPGTTFRLPTGVIRRPLPTPIPPRRQVHIDLSDDEGMKYVGGDSSDDGDDRSGDIKPSVLKPRNALKLPGEAPSGVGNSKFSEILARARYDPSSKVLAERSGAGNSLSTSNSARIATSPPQITQSRFHRDAMASGYGGRERIQRAPLRQTGPAKAMPVEEEGEGDTMTLDDIQDYHIHQKVKTIQTVLPKNSISRIYRTLLDHKANMDDAMNALVADEPEPPEADLPFSDNEVKETPQKKAAVTTKPTQRRQQTARIEERYRVDKSQRIQISRPSKPGAGPASPALKKQPSETSQPKPRSAEGKKVEFVDLLESSPELEAKTQQPAKRRLRQGRTRGETPPSSPPLPVRDLPSNKTKVPESDNDSSDVVIAESSSEKKTREFLNHCSIQELQDVASIEADIAQLMLDGRPFKNLDQARAVTKDEPSQEASGGRKRKRGRRVPIGHKIVDSCHEMLTAFQAIDNLLIECQKIGNPLTKQLADWGGPLAKASSISTATITDVPSRNRDSGIATPEDISATTDSLPPQPPNLTESTRLFPYQVVGYNWLKFLYDQRERVEGAILADEMGLGKTIQVIAFLAALREAGNTGPFLVIAPTSTIENWKQEFDKFCETPSAEHVNGISVMTYIGDRKRRDEVQFDIEEQGRPHVLVTTYQAAADRYGNKFLRDGFGEEDDPDDFKWKAVIVDEGHKLKNEDSNQHRKIMKIPTQFRLLLTGTPLQNNLSELATLLGFILPTLFTRYRGDLDAIFQRKSGRVEPAQLLSYKRIKNAKAMLAPFVLRRKKADVMANMPQKTRTAVSCEMTPTQARQYNDIVRNRAPSRAVNVKRDAASGVLTELRFAATHPMLTRVYYSNDVIREMAGVYAARNGGNPTFLYDDFRVMSDFELRAMCQDPESDMEDWALDVRSSWKTGGASLSTASYGHDGDDQTDEDTRVVFDSGKTKKLIELLAEFGNEGSRCLIFSQFNLVLNALEVVLGKLGIEFLRIDGSTAMDDRQPLIDLFNSPENKTYRVFMLSTTAGGAGINLNSASRVVIFEPCFNIFDAIQAENRAHRINSQASVKVFVLVSKGTVEERIYKMGIAKLELEARVTGDIDEDQARDEGKELERKLKEQLRSGTLSVEEENDG